MEIRHAMSAAVAMGALIGALGAALASPERFTRSFFRHPDDAASSRAAAAAATSGFDAPAQFDIPVVRNEYVDRFVELFRDRQTDRMALYLKRGGRYEGMIRAKLRERGMPEDLLYLAMIESGFNPNARSKAEAVGLWQFVAGTARLYGLRVDAYVDERRDPEKSTDAALRYLDHLYARFGSWNLAAAAYNTGEHRVARIMREETGGEKGDEESFWQIRPRLPGETREYVPLIFAAAVVGKEPEKHGLRRVEKWLPVDVEPVAVPGGTPLTVVAEAIGHGEAQLRALNPQLVRGITPTGETYAVRVPQGRADAFAAGFERARTVVAARTPPRPAAARTAAHTVRRGESLSVIARRHGVSVASLQRANGMGRRTGLQPGQRLRIPG